MSRSAEAKVLESVIEEDLNTANMTLSEFLDGELIELYGQLSTMIDLVTAEARRRGMQT